MPTRAPGWRPVKEFACQALYVVIALGILAAIVVGTH